MDNLNYIIAGLVGAALALFFAAKRIEMVAGNV